MKRKWIPCCKEVRLIAWANREPLRILHERDHRSPLVRRGREDVPTDGGSPVARPYRTSTMLHIMHVRLS